MCHAPDLAEDREKTLKVAISRRETEPVGRIQLSHFYPIG